MSTSQEKICEDVKKNYFDHDGKPNLRDQVEIVKVLALWGGLATAAYTFVGYALYHPDLYLRALATGSSIVLVTLALWATFLAFFAIKGSVKASEINWRGLALFLVMALGIVFPILYFLSECLTKH